MLYFSGQIVSKPVNPSTDNYKEKLNAQASVRAGLEEYNNMKETKPPTSTLSAFESTQL